MKGEIWLWDDIGNYRAVITNHHIANKLFECLKKDRQFKRGDEALLDFTDVDLPKVIKVLRVITNLEIAKNHASNFNNLDTHPPTVLDSKTKAIDVSHGK